MIARNFLRFRVLIFDNRFYFRNKYTYTFMLFIFSVLEVKC